MEESLASAIHREKLEACINTLRDILNEMCCTIDKPENNKEKLTVSCQLDDLIVEYMNLDNHFTIQNRNY